MSQRLKKRIRSWDPADTVAHVLFDTVPTIFSNKRSEYRKWRRQLGELLGIDDNQIVLVGSAACGYSLNPNKPLKKFGPTSDIDIAIISPRHFDEAWDTLRRLDIQDPRLTLAQRAAIKQHQYWYVYWGCIATDRILSLMPFARIWMPARSSMSAVSPTTGRSINFRLYKDFGALTGYQARGIEKLRGKLP